jgi:cytochrome b6-f complex iron-sulfur subunit
MSPKQPDRPEVSRRGLIMAGAGAGLGVATLVACGGGGSRGSGGYGAGEVTPTASPSPRVRGDAELVRLAEVPVGGAVSATDGDGNPVIVAQPTDGEVVAFSAVCTHRGCTVAPQGEVLRCPCHGSTYDLATGDNTGGPAPRPLEDLPVSVVDGVVTEG